MPESIIQQVEHDLEAIFPPKPGGFVDRERKRLAGHEARRREAEERGSESPDVKLGRNKVAAVRTITEAPDLGVAMTVTLGANAQWASLIPRDEHRRSAVILAVDNDVYITSDPGAATTVAGSATGTQGFYLPKGVPVTLASKAQWWTATTTVASTSRVSVLSFRESAP